MAEGLWERAGGGGSKPFMPLTNAALVGTWGLSGTGPTGDL